MLRSHEITVAVPGRKMCITCPEGATYGWLLSQLLRVASDEAVTWSGLRTFDGHDCNLGEEISCAAAVIAVEDAADTAAAKSTAATEHAAAMCVTRCIRRAGAQQSMAAIVETLRRRLATMRGIL